jgi:integrase
MRKDLTDAYLRTIAPPPEGRFEVRDETVRGLVFRLTHKGAASWCVRAYTREGKEARVTIGTYPAVGLSAARKLAKASLAAIQGGADPVEEKRAARIERERREAEPTVAERLEAWCAAREADDVKPWSARTADEVRRAVKRDIVPALGAKALRETTRADWTAIVEKKKASNGSRRKTKRAPAMATALYRYLSAFLGFAEAHGWIETVPLARKGLSTVAPPPKSRDRVLTDAELAEVWHASEREAPKVRAFVRLLVLTAAREMEVADVSVGEIDRDDGCWRVPGSRTKNGQPYAVPLCSLALAEIAPAWPKNDEERPDWRLLGKYADSGFRGFSKLKARLDAAIAATREKEAAERGAEPVPMAAWRWHDLRRTARTGMTRLGVQRDHAEAAINHVSARSALERTYDRHDYAPEIAAALGRWQAHVAALVGQAPPSAEVVPLRRAG